MIDLRISNGSHPGAKGKQKIREAGINLTVGARVGEELRRQKVSILFTARGV